MSRNGRVIVAMSGGVDSSVAACLLKEQGYECIGVFLRVGIDHGVASSCPTSAPDAARPDSAGSHAGPVGVPAPPRRLRHGCCSARDAQDAQAVARRLGIPFYALNFREEFEEIIDYFVDEYARARTPNPCVMCNIRLKFGKLLRYADLVGAEFVATGHYARIVERPAAGDRPSLHGPAGSPAVTAPPGVPVAACLARARNRAKDQSYVLFGIRRQDLGRCRFPLGEFDDKAQVRSIAARLGLEVHDKPDSQEICFIPADGDYRQLLRQRRPELGRPGPLRDAAGRRLGMHRGLSDFTIGQRRRLGIALGLPLYVTALEAETNTVVVGPRSELLRRRLTARDVNWLSDPPGDEARAEVKIRYMHTPAAGRIRHLADGGVEVCFDAPQPAITPGQAAVFYDGEIVLGGGWIESSAP